MLRAGLVLMVCMFGMFTLSCGESCGGICGSECELVDCSYTDIKCDLYPAPTPGIVIHYRTELEGGGYEWTARIFIDLEDIPQAEGLLLEGEEFLDRVALTRPGGGGLWHDFSGKDCKIESGGDEVGKGMSGQCNFSFVNGYFATFNFSCTLESVIED